MEILSVLTSERSCKTGWQTLILSACHMANILSALSPTDAGVAWFSS